MSKIVCIRLANNDYVCYDKICDMNSTEALLVCVLVLESCLYIFASLLFNFSLHLASLKVIVYELVCWC